MIGSAFFFSLMSLQVKLAGQELPTSEIVFARSFLSLIVTFVMIRGAGVPLWGRRKRLLVLRGLFGFVGLLCFFHATTHLPLAEVTVLHYTNPVFTAILAGVALGEGMRRRELLGLAACLAGVLLVAKPAFLFGGAAALDPRYVAIAVLGALFSAAAYVTVRKLGETEHHLTVILYFPLIATPASLPLMIPEAVWPSPRGWLLLLGVAAATQLAQIFLTKGLHAERAGRAMSVSYVQILFAATWGALVFGDRPDAWTVVGAACIVGGALLVARAKDRGTAISTARSADPSTRV